MTYGVLLDAITRLEGDWLDEALCERDRLLRCSNRRIKPLTVKRLATLAACMAVVLTVGLFMKTAFTGHHSPAPHPEYYATVEEVETALGASLLLDTLEKDTLTRSEKILVSYSTNDDGSVSSTPLMLKARYTVNETDNSPEITDAVTYVDLYVLFDKKSVEDCYIAGYVEQGLSKQYGDIKAVYSLVEDPMMHGQAKFLYDGDLYVLDVSSTGDTHLLMKYLDMLLESEGAS